MISGLLFFLGLSQFAASAEFDVPDKLVAAGNAVFASTVTITGKDSNRYMVEIRDPGAYYRVIVTTGGNVGIGTTAPAGILQVLSSTSQPNAVVISTGADSGSYIVLISTAGKLQANEIYQGPNKVVDASMLDNFTLKMDSGIAGVADRIEQNTLLLAFKMSVLNGGMSKFNMVDGMMDEFQDTSGVDASISTAAYNSTATYYGPVPNYGSDLLPNNGVNITAKSYYNSYYPSNSCDDNNATIWLSEVNVNHDEWVQEWFGAGNAKTIQKMTLTPDWDGSTARLKDFKLQGSNDGVNFTDVFSGEHGNNGNKEEFTFSNSAAYEYWRLYGVNSWNSGNEITVREWEIMEAASVSNMTLISNATPAEEPPNKARIALFEEDVSTVTLNADLKAFVSRDGGATWAPAVLADEGDYGTNQRIISSNVVDISTQPAGTSIKWKVTTHNSRNLRLHGVGLNWDF